jgi:hypothetical protein
MPWRERKRERGRERKRERAERYHMPHNMSWYLFFWADEACLIPAKCVLYGGHHEFTNKKRV